jgi:hypothetical protein
LKKHLSKLVEIIDQIESERINKISLLQEFTIGRTVKWKDKIGKVQSISPKKTSVIVEFTDKTRKRFFMNKRANKETIEQLSLTNIIKEIK